MKVALCHDRLFPARGGCETYIADIARRLASDGHQVDLLATDWDGQALPRAVKNHRLFVPPGPRWLRPWSFSAACRKALRALPEHVSIGFGKVFGTDVLYPQGGLHAASFEQNLFKYRSQVARGLARVCKVFDPGHRSYAWFEQQQYQGKLQPLIIAISQMVERHFFTYYGVSPERLRLLRAAVDPARLDAVDPAATRREARLRWGLGEAEAVGLFVAMNYELKGIRPLLRSLAWLPRQHAFRLLVVGHPNTKSYERLAARLGVAQRLCFVGPCRDVRPCYAAADFLVHPTFYDPCSLVVLEALACGLPVITSRFNGAAELIGHGREGYVIDNPHDHEQLASFIAQLLDPVGRGACAHAARRAGSLWTLEHHYRQLLAILDEVRERKVAARKPTLVAS